MSTLACPVFLINLDGSLARLESASAQMRMAGVGFTRLSAIDGRGHRPHDFPQYDDATSRALFGRPMTSGEIGCYLSHISAARRILDSAAPAGLVLEDDFKARPGAWAIARQLLGALDAQVPGWELVNLSRAPRLLRRSQKGVIGLGGAATLYRAHYFPVISTALLWSRAGAERFLRQAARPCGPVDHVIRRLMCERGQGFAVDPAPFGVTGVESDIGAASAPHGPQARRLGPTQLAEIRRQSKNIALALRSRLLGPRAG